MKYSLVVAHHEAGHGVIAYALGVKLRRLQLNEDSCGIVEIATGLRRSDLEDWSDFLVGSGDRLRTERYIIINLAGPYAQRRCGTVVRLAAAAARPLLRRQDRFQPRLRHDRQGLPWRLQSGSAVPALPGS